MHKSNRGAHGHCDWQACLSLCLHVSWKRVTCSPLTWRQFVAWAFQHALGSNCTLAGFAVWSQNAFASVERWRMAASSVDPWNQWSQEKPWRDFDSRRRQESWCGMIQTTRDAPFGNPANRLSGTVTCPKHLEALRPAREVSPDFPDAHCQLALTCSAWRHLYEQKEELEVRMFRVSKAVRKAGVYICRLK